MSDALFIPGPCGHLEAEITHATSPATGLGVLCHPHPGYGGSRHDAVLDCVAQVLQHRGIDVLRFNFRGVGASAGSIQGDGSEVDDLLAVAAWAEQELAPAELWLGGYSFGAAVAWQALDSLRPHRLLLVAPPIGRMHFESRSVNMPAHVFVGSEDDFVDTAALERLPGLRVVTLEGADHFFSGQHDTLVGVIEGALER